MKEQIQKFYGHIEALVAEIDEHEKELEEMIDPEALYTQLEQKIMTGHV